jgi:hypothetical protein
MSRLPRPYPRTIAALVAEGHSFFDLSLPQWARLTLALAPCSPQRYTTLCRQTGIPRESGAVAIKWAVAYGVVEHCGGGVYRYCADTLAQHTDQLPARESSQHG